MDLQIPEETLFNQWFDFSSLPSLETVVLAIPDVSNTYHENYRFLENFKFHKNGIDSLNIKYSNQFCLRHLFPFQNLEFLKITNLSFEVKKVYHQVEGMTNPYGMSFFDLIGGFEEEEMAWSIDKELQKEQQEKTSSGQQTMKVICYKGDKQIKGHTLQVHCKHITIKY